MSTKDNLGNIDAGLTAAFGGEYCSIVLIQHHHQRGRQESRLRSLTIFVVDRTITWGDGNSFSACIKGGVRLNKDRFDSKVYQGR